MKHQKANEIKEDPAATGRGGDKLASSQAYPPQKKNRPYSASASRSFYSIPFRGKRLILI